MTRESRRRRLDTFVETGRLRDALMRASADSDVADLVVDLCVRYCTPRRTRRTALRAARESGTAA